ncbi:uncharacterized protein TNCT_485821 [Trichonephila clavata]|uniref:Uncharacterized protein n=1 Tax=Trichonephila clavata TaxID=2740835 RepID=A0A8X6KF30_TRICU|nr:uncharacterized protein TNCT_485821 [Trichonephila clavata]
MRIEACLEYFNNACKISNKDNDWKMLNISKYLKGSALTHYINSCLNISNFDDLCNILIENFLKPNIVNLSDFSQHQLRNNLDQYFHQKLNCGRQLGLSPQLILEGLTDGEKKMPTNIKQLMTINPPTSPTEWLMSISHHHHLDIYPVDPDRNWTTRPDYRKSQSTPTLEHVEFHKIYEPTMNTLVTTLNNSRTSEEVASVIRWEGNDKTLASVIRGTEDMEIKLREFPFSPQEVQSSNLRQLGDVLDEAKFKFTHTRKLEIAEQQKILQTQIDAWGVLTKPLEAPFQVILSKKEEKIQTTIPTLKRPRPMT